MEKRGQDISLTTILLMVLGVVVIVLLIWGFSSGWSNMWNKVTGFGGGKSNVDVVKQSCDLACQGNQKDAFCVKKWTVEFGENRETLNSTGGHVNATSITGTCNDFAKNSTYGVSISPCPICA